MSFITKLLSGGRVRRARREVAQNPTAKNYGELAREHACHGNLAEVQRVCAEGLSVFPGNAELVRLANRARQMQREDRTRELMRELKISPRPAVWHELCTILLESGRVRRAEEHAERWYSATRDAQALLMRARARLERFLADRRRDDGRYVVELLDHAEKLLPRDPAPLRMRLQLTARIGATAEEKRVVSRLLDLEPGDPQLEVRFRTLLAHSGDSRGVDQALREVERTGQLVGEGDAGESDEAPPSSIRPLLQELVAETGVRAAVYVRGATALVQGPTGATAERAARAVREVVSASRTAARRLGIGRAESIRLEGGFGCCMVATGDTGSSALWSEDPLSAPHERVLADLAGASATAVEERT